MAYKKKYKKKKTSFNDELKKAHKKIGKRADEVTEALL